VRRVIATLLAALFSVSLMGPVLFASDADANLPACCRRAGKHHCAEAAGGQEAPSGPRLQSARCPIYPDASTAPTNRNVGLPAMAWVASAGIVSHPASCLHAETLCLISYSLAGQKRGPPALFA